MQRNTTIFAGAMTALMMALALVTPFAAQASEEGKKNTTLGLGALTGYLFTRRGSKVPAFIGLGATAYAYKQYNDSIRARHRRQRAYAYNHRRYGTYAHRTYAHRTYARNHRRTHRSW